MKRIINIIRKNVFVFMIVLFTIVLLAIYVFLAAKGTPHLLRWGCVFIILYLIGTVILRLIYVRFIKKSPELSEKKSTVSSYMLDSNYRIDIPVLMCSKDGTVFWANEKLSAVLDPIKPAGKNISELLNVKKEIMIDQEDRRKLRINLNSRTYAIEYSSIKREQGGFLIFLYDITNAVETEKRLDSVLMEMKNKDVVVAYIYVDNLAEMLQYDTESYRPASSKVDEILRTWANESKGVIKESERDRYIYVFEHGYLDEMIAKKFDILDRVRDIRVGNDQLSVTVSIGIADVTGSLFEKERAAQNALEMALSRGGDQVALKRDSETKYFGGRTKSSRRYDAAIQSRTVANELIVHISNASNVLIMGHVAPDYDCIGALVGLAKISNFCGVETRIVTDLTSSDFIECQKMLSDRREYDNIFISSYSAMDYINDETLVILADVNNLKIVESRDILTSTKNLAIIDHHRKHAEYERQPVLEYIEPKASSACELVSEMLEMVLPPESQLSASEANVILSGIVLDTKSFTKNTGTRTYGAALYLHERGADPQKVQNMFKTALEEYKIEASFRQNVVVYRSCMAITKCGDDIPGDDQAKKVAASKAADNLVDVKGIKAAFAIVRLNGKRMHISARSTGEVNVQVILEKLRGGGHFDTAGAQLLDVSAEEAVVMLKEAIDESIG